MAKARHRRTVKLIGVVRRNRPALMMSTALRATVLLVLSLPAHAQPAPNARPMGGVVVAGSAVISRTSNNTAIDQSSQRAAVNWQSFNVGSQQSVTFNQPSTSAVTLNRVTGPDPSQIAGRIDANGQVVLINRSGVTFYKGAQVNASGVLVSTANVTNQNFMAGKMTLDQPGNPNARVVNQGNITVKQAGLAALVAPQVRNSGTITAKLGHVVLAGAKTATLDLYGDGLLSLDVSNQVTQAPVGKDGKPVTALVTNSGVIRADGGTVQLTARAADGVVQNLVDAGGKIRTATMGDQTGTIALNGVGGSIVVEGQLSAPGRRAGTVGGNIEVASSGNVIIGSKARINASGKAGGGTVAIGTTLARAQGGPGVTPTLTATNVTVNKGARIAANATVRGNGGKVTVLSTGTTVMNGTISATGGSIGGDGGFIETSGKGILDIGSTASITAAAPHGNGGSWLLDPDSDVDITNVSSNFACVAGTCGPTADSSTVDAGILAGVLDGGTSITVTTSNPAGTQAGNITVDNQIALLAPHAASLTLNAGAGGGAGTITLNQPIIDGGSGGGTLSLILNAGGGITFNSTVSIAGSLTATAGMNAAGNITLGTNGFLQVAGFASFTNQSSNGLITLGLNGAANVGQLTGGVALHTTGGAGNVLFSNDGGASGTVLGTSDIQGTASIVATSGGISQSGVLKVTGAATISASSSNQSIILDTQTNALSGGVAFSTVGTGGNVSLKNSGGTSLRGLSVGGTFSLEDTTGSISQLCSGLRVDGAASFKTDATGQTISLDNIRDQLAGVLTFNTTGSGANVTLTNSVSTTLAASTIGGGLTFDGVSGSTLALNGLVSGGSLSITDAGVVTLNAGTYTVTGGVFPNVTTNGDLILGHATQFGNVTLGSDTTFDSSANSGNITFAKIDGAQGLIVNAGTGVVTFNDAVGGTTPLTSIRVTSDPVISANVTTHGGGQTYNGPISLTNSVTLADTGGGSIALGGQVTADANSLTLSTSGLEALSGVTTTGNLTLGTPGRLNLNGGIYTIGGGGSPYVFPAVPTTLGGGTLTLGQATTFAGAVTGNSATTVDSSGANGAIDFAATISSQNPATLNLTIAAGTGIVTLGNVGSGTAPLAGLSVTGGGISLGGAITAQGTLALSSTGSSALMLPVSLNGGVVSLSSGGAISQTGGSITAGTLVGSAGGTVALTGSNAINAIGSFSVSGGDFDLNNIGSLQVLAPVTASNVTITAGNIDVSAGSVTAVGSVSLTGTTGLTFDSNALVSAGTILLDGAGITAQSAIIGKAGAVIDVSVTGANDFTGDASSRIIAGTLQATAPVGGSVSLTGNNTIAAVGSFASTGPFRLDNVGSIEVAGPISASAVSIMAGTIGVTGNVSAGSGTLLLHSVAGGITLGADLTGRILDLSSADGITQTGGSITATTLQSSNGVSGNVTLQGTSNAIATIGSFAVSNGGFAATDSGSLSVIGPLTGNNITLDAPTITATGSIGGSTVDFSAGSGGVTQSGGTISAAILQSTNGVTGNVSLLGTNRIASVGSFATNGTFQLVDSILPGTLTVAGPLSANNVTLRGAPLYITGTIAGSAAVDLSSTGNVTETSTGAIFAGTLQSSSGVQGNVTLIGSNQVSIVGAFDAGGNFMLNDAGLPGALTASGPIVGNNVTLSGAAAIDVSGSIAADSGTVALASGAGGIALAGNITAATLDLSATGTGISQTTGNISATTLQSTGGVSGGVSLLGTANEIANLGSFTLAGTASFSLLDISALNVSGAVTVPGTASQLYLHSSNSGGISIGSGGELSANAGSGLVSLQTDAFTNSGSIGTATFELAPSTRGSLVTLGTTGGLSLLSLSAISASHVRIGAVTGPNASGPTTTSGAIVVGGNFGDSGVVLELDSIGGISEAGGAILTASELTGSAGGSVILPNINVINTLGNFGAGSGNFVLADDPPLVVTGSVSAPAQVYLQSTDSGGIIVAAGATLSAGTLASFQTDAFANSGTIRGTTFEWAPNTPGATQTLVSSAGIGPSLLHIGAVTLPGNASPTTTAGSIVVAEPFGSSGVTLELDSQDRIAQTSNGIVTAGTLTGTAVTGVNLGATANAITTLGSVGVSGGAFTLDDGALTGSLTISGPITGTTIAIRNAPTISLAGTINGGTLVALDSGAGGIAFAGSANISAGTLDLSTAGGGISETSGIAITADTLQSSGGIIGALDLGSPNNIANLGSIAVSGGNLALNDSARAGTLGVGGPITGNNIMVVAGSGMLVVTGSIGSPGITSLDASNPTAGIALNNGAAITGATIELSGGSIGVALNGNALLGNAGAVIDVTTTAGGLIEASTATISAGTLQSTGGIGGDVSLPGAANAIADIGSLAVGNGTFSLNDAANLNIAGPLIASGITIADAGNIAISGLLSDGGSGTTSLTATAGTINETGSLIAGTLSGSALQAANLNGSSPVANQVATLGSFTASAFTLRDGTSLNLTGPLVAGSSATIVDAAGLSVTGTITQSTSAIAVALTAANLNLPGFISDGGTGTTSLVATSGAIAQNGTLIAGTLSGGSSGATNLLGATTTTDQVATLGNFSASSLTLNDTIPLSVAGVVSAPTIGLMASSIAIPGTISGGAVNLVASAGPISETGALIAGALSGSTPGSASFTGATPTTNRIASFGNFTASGLSLADGTSLTIAGTLNAGPTVALTNAGSINETGTLIAATLSGSATGSANFTGANQISTVSSFSASGFALNDAVPLTISGNLSGGPSMTIIDNGTLTIGADAIASATAIGLTANNIAVLGALTDGGTGTINLIANGGAISASGPVTSGELSGSATGAAAFINAANQIAALGAFTAAGLTLLDNANLAIGGMVNAGPSAVINDAGAFSISPGAALIANSISVTTNSNIGIHGVMQDANNVNLVSRNGAIDEDGTLVADVLTMSASGNTSLTGAGNQIAHIGDVTSGGTLSLNDAVALLISGAVSAPSIFINTGANAITLADKATITTGGIQRPPGIVAGFPPNTSTLGAFLTTSKGFTQLGNSTILGFGGGPSVLRINASGASNISFDQTQGLQGSTTWLILSLGSGTASGQINVRSLDILGSGNGGSAQLTGMVNGLAGPEAAAEAGIQPSPNTDFRINACAIHSVNCVLLPTQGVPVANPLNQINIGTLFNSNEEEDLLLPIVSNRDY